MLDVLQDDPVWASWSQAQLETASLAGRLFINPVVYSELSIAFERIEELESVLEEMNLYFDLVPREALFLAGKAYLQYRRRTREKRGVLPDFYIGAHAAVLGAPILTRDRRRYSTYFPTVRLIGPD